MKILDPLFRVVLMHNLIVTPKELTLIKVFLIFFIKIS